MMLTTRAFQTGKIGLLYASLIVFLFKVSNATPFVHSVLVQEESPLAVRYQNKSVAEQNSVDLAWGFLMEPEFHQLRNSICCDDEEFARFRSLVVNVSYMCLTLRHENDPLPNVVLPPFFSWFSLSWQLIL